MRTALRLLILPLITLVLIALSAGASAAPTDIRARVGEDVRTALQTDSDVAVIVSLATPAGAAGASVDVEAQRREVAAAQAAVRARAGDFALTRRYRVVPALAGLVDAAGLAQLEADPNVVAVSLDRPLHTTLAESVLQIGAHHAHSFGVTGVGAVVAVLDTGIDIDHADLSDDLLSEACFLVSAECHNEDTSDTGPGSADDDHGHGSHVSGIVTSGGVVGSVGVAPDAGIRAYKVLNAAGSGVTSDVLAALDDVIANYPDTDAVNMSLSDGMAYAPGTCDDNIPAFTSAVAALRANETVVVASAGNGNVKNATSYPACISTIVSAGAVYDASLGMATFTACTDPSSDIDQVPCFSNSDTSLRVLAPGCLTFSAHLGGGIVGRCGTSMAAPHVAGAVALLRDHDGTLTADEVESCLETTGVPVTDEANGITTPRINVPGAMGCAGLDIPVGGLAAAPEVVAPPASGGMPALALVAIVLTALAAAGWAVRARLRRA